MYRLLALYLLLLSFMYFGYELSDIDAFLFKSEHAAANVCAKIFFLFGAVTCLILFFVDAPYGGTYWGPIAIKAKYGWVLMESPAVGMFLLISNAWEKRWYFIRNGLKYSKIKLDPQLLIFLRLSCLWVHVFEEFASKFPVRLSWNADLNYFFHVWNTLCLPRFCLPGKADRQGTIVFFCFVYSAHAQRPPRQAICWWQEKPMSLMVVLFAFFWTAVNGWLNGLYCFELSGPVSMDKTTVVRIVLGLLLFCWGLRINRESDEILRNLRSPGDLSYKVFRNRIWVQCHV